MSAFQEIKNKDYKERTELENAIIFTWSTSYYQTALKAADQLSMLEENCANAIQANIEVAQLNVALQEKIEEFNTPMPCGHLARYAVNEEAGTQYCAVCNGDALFEAGKKALEYINKMNEFARACIRYAGNSGDDYLADKAREALGENNYE